jgi:hypothetical protein
MWIACGSSGIAVKTAPWKMGIQDAIGVRAIRGKRYFLWVSDAGPSCAFAKRKLAEVARLRTVHAVEVASFDSFHCRAGRLDPRVIWVRPRGAWAGCWSSPNGAPIGPYFFWELAVPPPP